MPLPEPLAPPVMVIQETPLVAVQGQPPVLVTTTLLLPPVEASEVFVGEIEAQGGVLSDDQETQLKREETLYESLQELYNEKIGNSIVAQYLKGVGTFADLRGIGKTVPIYYLDELHGEYLSDDRDVYLAIGERFPGAYFSRQKRVNRVTRMIYDVTGARTVFICPSCNNWSDDQAVTHQPNCTGPPAIQRALEVRPDFEVKASASSPARN